jgi:hypothetical protein
VGKIRGGGRKRLPHPTRTFGLGRGRHEGRQANCKHGVLLVADVAQTYVDGELSSVLAAGGQLHSDAHGPFARALKEALPVVQVDATETAGQKKLDGFSR